MSHYFNFSRDVINTSRQGTCRGSAISVLVDNAQGTAGWQSHSYNSVPAAPLHTARSTPSPRHPSPASPVSTAVPSSHTDHLTSLPYNSTFPPTQRTHTSCVFPVHQSQLVEVIRGNWPLRAHVCPHGLSYHSLTLFLKYLRKIAPHVPTAAHGQARHVPIWLRYKKQSGMRLNHRFSSLNLYCYRKTLKVSRRLSQICSYSITLQSPLIKVVFLFMSASSLRKLLVFLSCWLFVLHCFCEWQGISFNFNQ